MLLASGGGFGTLFVPMPLCDPFYILLLWLKLGSSLFFSFFSPLLSALFNGVCQGFIIKSQLQFHCTRKILLVLYIGYGPQRGQFWVFSTTPISRLMLGPCSKNTGLVITSQFNTFSHFSWIFCASTWIGYLSHQSSKMTALNSLSLVAMGWVHTTHPFRMLYSHLWALGGSQCNNLHSFVQLQHI